MRSIKFSLKKKSENPWEAAALLLEAYFSSKLKADQILDLLPEDFTGKRRARCQSLFLGALRHGHRSRAAYNKMLRKSPRAIVEAVLLIAGYEFFTEPEDRHPKIVHHAVERSKSLVKRNEQGFLNAVLRKMPEALATIVESDKPEDIYSHPDWLVTRWISEYGKQPTHSLLQWNQKIPEQSIRLYSKTDELPDFLSPTEWEGFFRISKDASWKDQIEPLISSGNAYIKDPSTRIAPSMLKPQSGMDVLDLCAAPGGKSYDLAYHMNYSGRIVCVDMPGNRINRLRDNLSRLGEFGIENQIVECDILHLKAETFSSRNLPSIYDAVMLDAPCSNTGVIQRRTDVKWRLQPEDIKKCAQLQLQLLTRAAAFVKPGGRILYSTCSIEAEENAGVVDKFLQTKTGRDFKLVDSLTSFPWESGHDGAGAALLLRTS